MISSKEARAQTLQKKEDNFSLKITKAIDEGFFSVSMNRIDWTVNWKPYVEDKLIKNGFRITTENDGWVYISWMEVSEI